MTKILIDLRDFIAVFPALSDTTQAQLDAAYMGVPSIISIDEGAINLSITLQRRGVYLAAAHIVYLSNNPQAYRPLTSATEGSVSAGFMNFSTKNAYEYWLLSSPYGVELLSLLSTVQPFMPKRNYTSVPYYQGGGGAGY